MSSIAELVDMLRQKNMKCSFAESLTGGMIASSIVDIPGASDVFDGSIISYTDAIKINVLGVDSEVIECDTAASFRCAEQMAQGVLRLMNSDFAISVTGIAGPGDYYGQKAGTVYFAVADSLDTVSYLMHFDGDRDSVRLQTKDYAIKLAWEYINEH